MSYRRGLLAALGTLTACATAGQPLEGSDAPPGGDDARVDARVDAQQQIDASCSPVQMELLMNAAFDTAPLGSSWTQTLIDQTLPIIVATGGVTAMSPSNKAWLGGLERATATNKDSVSQDVMVPAGTTSLVLTGSYQVKTAETLPIVFDSGAIELVTTTNAAIENASTFDNTHTTADWTALTKTFTTPHAGQTVRLRMTSASDSSNPTSFYFDSLSLKATVIPSGCP